MCMELYVEQVDNNFRLKEGWHVFVIYVIHCLTNILQLSELPGMEFTKGYLRGLRIMHLDGKSVRSWEVVKLSRIYNIQTNILMPEK